MQDKETKRMLLIVVANLFIVFLGIGLVVPVTPAIQQEMGLTMTTMGYLTAAYAAAQLVCSPIAGRFSDLYGRKRMIVVGMFVFAVSELLFGLGQTVSLLYISRLLGGLGAALIFPSVMAFVADMTSLEERPKAMGWVSGAISGGFIIGPGIGGFFGHYSSRLPFFAAFVLGLVGCLFAFFLLKEPERTAEQAEQAKEKVSIRSIIFSKNLMFPFLIILINAFGLAAFESLYSVYVVRVYGFNELDIAVIMVGSGVLALIAQLVFFDGMVKKLGEIGVIRICLFFSAAFVFIMLAAKGFWSVAVCTFVIFLAFDLLRPAVTTFLTKQAGNNQGTVNGVNSALTSVGNIAGPILAGTLMDIKTSYPSIVVTIILLISFSLTLIWKAPKPENISV
ncbi:MFS transporter [Vagococcus coleopterorum]|uniref:MFS transporter n=1 Tax=Vagococcus coleopterorum TaxID=2714946 RepID=A0A6G8AKU3_9ENTE|nr:MFS transporter [Vagococcus coleopterorum]QIL45678.1 MFS transporter [Vagococcus coleopterorum]